MQEIANQFKEEYTELLSRYKSKLPNAQLMPIIQSITRKELCWTNNPDLVKRAEHILHEGSLGRDIVAGVKPEGDWVVRDEEPL